MEMDELTQEQISSLTPEQIEILESEPDRLEEFLGKQAEKPGKSEQEEQDGAANGADEGTDEPVVLNKSGKGVIPYEKHKGLRVENADLRTQLEQAQRERDEAAQKMQDLLAQKDAATGSEDVAIADEAIAKHLAVLKDDMPELHEVISSVLASSKRQGERLDQTLAELKREREKSERETQMSVEEQVAEAKENNPDLLHWEKLNGDEWDEALKQDEILRTSQRWAAKPYEERFAEVVRRVRAILPDAAAPNTQTNAEATKARAKARLDGAADRQPTTLSDIQGGANPASEREQLENLSPFELTQKLMKMPAHQAAAMRADLD